MTLAQFRRAWAVAKDKDVDLSHEDLDVFWGFGLSDFTKVTCTIGQVARLIRWQCQELSGNWDMEAADDIRRLGKNRFIVID